MDGSLWNRLSVEQQAEVDRLVGIGRNVRAMVVMRECAGLPQPGIRECGDLVAERIVAHGGTP